MVPKTITKSYSKKWVISHCFRIYGSPEAIKLEVMHHRKMAVGGEFCLFFCCCKMNTTVKGEKEIFPLHIILSWT